MNRFVSTAVAVVVFLLAGTATLSWYGYREHTRNEAYQAYVQQFPGKGVRSRRQYDIFEHEGEAYRNVVEKRMREGMRLRLPRAEFNRRFDIVCTAAMAESRRVRNSNYNEWFREETVPHMKDIPPPAP